VDASAAAATAAAAAAAALDSQAANLAAGDAVSTANLGAMGSIAEHAITSMESLGSSGLKASLPPRPLTRATLAMARLTAVSMVFLKKLALPGG
jgi:hypothetical protein